jgi:hypothetical protein
MALSLVTLAAASSANDVCWCWCSAPNPDAKVGCWHGEKGSCRAQRGAASCVSEIKPIYGLAISNAPLRGRRIKHLVEIHLFSSVNLANAALMSITRSGATGGLAARFSSALRKHLPPRDFPLMFIPSTAASYDGIPPDKTGQASALINAARNTGRSIGISLISNVLWRREQFHQSPSSTRRFHRASNIRTRCTT